MDVPCIVFGVFMFVDGAAGAAAGAETVTEDTAGLDFFADATTGVDIVVAAGVDIVAAAGASIVADAVAGMVVASTVSFGLDGMHSP